MNRRIAVLAVGLLVCMLGCSRDQAKSLAKRFDPCFPGKAATHVVELTQVQIGANDFNLSSFGNPLDIKVSLMQDGQEIAATTGNLLSGRRGERILSKRMQWVVQFDPNRNYQINLEEQSIIAKAVRWSMPATPRLGYWVIAQNNGRVKFGGDSYLQFSDKVAQ